MKYVLMFTSLLLCCGLVPAVAQDVPTIEYGQTVTGELNNRFFEIEYRFTGTEGDVIFVEMQAAEDVASLNNPAIILLNTDYKVLASVEGYAQSVEFFAELPYTGEYSLLATREGGRAGDSVGEYTLDFNRLQELEPDVPLTGKIAATSVDHYAVRTKSAFTVTYERLTRGLYPRVRIAVLQEDYGLWDVAELSGDNLVSGALGIAPEESNAQMYIVMVDTSYSYQEGTIEYTLTLK